MLRNILFSVCVLLITVGTSSAAGGARSAQELLSSFQQAHRANSADQLVSLVRFTTDSVATKQRWRNDFSKELGQVGSKIYLEPYSTYEATVPAVWLAKRPKSYKLCNWLVVEFPANGTPDSHTQESNLYMVAEENGEYFIVGP